MKKLFILLFIIMATTCLLFSETGTEVKPVSDSDFKVISDNGTELWLSEDIDDAVARFNLTFDGLFHKHSSNPALDDFKYSNDDIILYKHRKWKHVNTITLKTNRFRLNRGIRVGDPVKSIYTKFKGAAIHKDKEGDLLIMYNNPDESSLYYFSANLWFIIKDNVIEKIHLTDPSPVISAYYNS